MIPIEYLWYIIGGISVPVFIWIYLKALKRNRADKARVAMRRKRFERTMKSGKRIKSNTGKVPASERIVSAVENPASTGSKSSAEGHWLRAVKLPPERGQTPTTSTGHWLEHVKPKRKHWLDNLRRKRCAKQIHLPK